MGRQSQVRESLPKGTITAGFQRCSLSENRGLSGLVPARSRLAMPDQRHFSTSCGERVGGARRRPARVRPGEILGTARARDGGRHPGLQEAVALRGAAVERRSRPVRLVRSGSPPLRAVAPATEGCPLDAEEGNVVGVREQGVRNRSGRHRPHRVSGTRPSLGPGTRAPSSQALVRRKLTRKGAPAEVGATSGPRKRSSRQARSGPGSRSGKPGFPEEPITGLGRPDAARLAVSQLFRSRGSASRAPRSDSGACLGHQNRDGGCGLLPRTRGHEEPRASARTSWQLQKSSGVVGPRISSRHRPPKRGPTRVNGGLARGGFRQSASQGAPLSGSASRERTNEIRTAP